MNRDAEIVIRDLHSQGFSRIGVITKGGKVLEEHFFNAAGLCVTIDYTHLKED